MSITHAALGGLAGGVVSVFTSWLITGTLFHRFQSATPATWRPEGPKQYALASALNLFTGMTLGVLFGTTGGVSGLTGSHWWLQGLVFGCLCWASLPLPMQLTGALFVNFHRGFVVGSLLDLLATCVLAGLGAAWAAA
jgi:hypothetical protein